MKKTITLSLAALFFAASPLLAEEITQSKESEQVNQTNLSLSKNFVEFVKSQYLSGHYKEFLQQMEKDYQQAKKDQGLQGLIEMRKEDAAIASSHASTADHWQQVAQSWTQERNKELLQLIDSKDQSILAEKIRSVTQPLDPSAEQTLAYFAHLRSLTPGEGKNADENLLIENDLELEYKQIHFDSLSSLERWTPDAQEKRLALRLEAADKLLAASQKFEDKDLKAKVETLSRFLDAYYIRQIDLKDLHRLAMGALTPTGDLEKKAAAILSAYEGKFSELTKEILQQTQSE